MKLRTICYSLITVFFITSCSSDDEIDFFLNTSDFQIEIDENPISGQEIGTIEGSTNQGVISFSIVSQTPDGSFSIDTSSGVIKVLNADAFDFEVNPVIVGVVEVTNGDLKELSTVTLTIKDIEEDVFNGNVLLTTQEDIDAFGSNGYKIINGDLIIDEDQTIHNIVFLDALSSIEEIKGVLKLNNLFNLLDIPGFENLSIIGGLEITNNWGIGDVNSLSSITNCDGPIIITNNSSLGSFCGIRPLLQSGNFNDAYTVSDNFYNPTQQDIIDGNCDGF